MTTYIIVKYLHILFAIGWLGGGFCMVLLGVAASRARNDGDLVRVMGQMAWLAKRVFVPFSGLALLCGLAMTWLGGMWGEAWIILGLIGFAATAGTGMTVLGPKSEKVAAIAAKEGASPAAVRVAREMLSVARFDITMLAVVVADMVLKPSFDDYAVLIAMAVVLVAAAAYFLMPLRSAHPAAA
jgi:uncharacterized membrane protein